MSFLTDLCLNSMRLAIALLFSCTLLSIASAQASCNLSLRNQTRCAGLGTALGDDRIRAKPSQCRVACESFYHPGIAVSTVSAYCSFDLCDLQTPFSAFSFDTRICQPRTLCIKACGEEPPGCVHSGSCREFTCFKDKITGRPANFSRITFAGPRSIVQVNSSKTSDFTLRETGDAVINSRDKCSEDEKPHLYDSDCEPVSNRTFLSDNRSSNTEPVSQCRAVCRNARHNDVEMVRMRTNCGSCGTRNGTYICERESSCHEQCESSFSKTAGCVFNGSCRSMICLSGIDSKLPAVVSVNDHTGLHGAIVSVDNDAAPIAEDPPVFMNYLADVEVPNSTTLRGDLGMNDNQSGTDEEEKGAEDNGAGEEKGAEDNGAGEEGAETESGEESMKETVSKWIWLGPLVGLFGAVLTAIAAIGAAYITRRSSSFIVPVGSRNGLFHGADAEAPSKISHDSKLRFHLTRPDRVI